MGWVDGYRRSLKSVDVEETIDLYFHRPLAYLLARALLPTGVTPNQVTLLSMLLGIACGALIVSPFPGHLGWAALALVLSAIVDCADGQLARMRGTSSAFGRMLDGCSDFTTTVASVGGCLWLLHLKYAGSAWHWPLLLIAVGTAYTGSFHTASHDHYKNVYLKFTVPGFKDSEDVDQAEERWRSSPKGALWLRLFWWLYHFYLRNQARYVQGADRYTPTRLRQLPPFSEVNAAIYREECRAPMRSWSRYYGFGSLVFGMALAIGFNLPEVYCCARFFGQNLAFFAWLRPLQQERSRRALERMGIDVAQVTLAR